MQLMKRGLGMNALRTRLVSPHKHYRLERVSKCKLSIKNTLIMLVAVEWLGLNHSKTKLGNVIKKAFPQNY